MSFLTGINNTNIRDTSYVNNQPVNPDIASNNTAPVSGEPAPVLNGESVAVNLSATSPVIAALNSASLPVNESNINIAGAMMDLGMSIDANTLMSMVSTSGQYPDIDPVNLIYMKQYGIEINNENVVSFNAFKNYESFVMDGINQVADDIPKTINSLINNGDTSKAVQFVSDIIDIFANKGTAESSESNNAAMVPGENQTDGVINNSQAENTNIANADPAINSEVLAENAVDKEAMELVGKDSTVLENPSSGANVFISEVNTLAEDANNSLAEAIANEETEVITAKDSKNFADIIRAAVSRTEVSSPSNQFNIPVNENVVKDGWQGLTTAEKASFVQVLKDAGIPEASAKALYNQETTTADFLNVLNTVLKEGHITKDIKDMLGSNIFGAMIKNQVKEQWLLKPEDRPTKEDISNLYERLENQTKELTKSLASIVRSDMPLQESLNNMNNNMDFMNQMNNMYQYVQIPLKMNGSEATGDLFVYTNKKNLANKDGSVSALLHLDMANLGPVDVYASITPGNNVFTKFYLKDDATIDFINDNIHILNERLEKRGYSTKAEIVNKNDNSSETDRIEALKKAGSIAPRDKVNNSNAARLIKKYSFDIRA